MIHKESMTPDETMNYLKILKEDYPEAYKEAKRTLNKRYGIEASKDLKRGQEINEALEGFIKESWGCCK